jgi:hypothetical protein
LLIKAKIPQFINEWPETQSTRGGFGSTGQNFEKTTTNNFFNAVFPYKKYR